MFVRSLILAAALAAAVPAGAVTIAGLYNTGVDNAGVATTGNGVDLHWTLTGGTAFTGGTNGNFPIGPWLAETSTSRWITPTNNAADGVGSPFVFVETFSLAGLNPTTAALSGRFSGDNGVTAVFLNGTLISSGADGFTAFTAFSAASSAFVAGTNTLTFDLRNDGGPAGLRVEVAGTADASAVVPEPAMWGLMIVGFGMVGVSARRRRTTVAA
jgi:hypothetical protein